MIPPRGIFASAQSFVNSLEAGQVKHEHAASVRAKEARALRSLTAYATPEPEAGRREPATWAPVCVMWSFRASSASDLHGAQPRHVHTFSPTHARGEVSLTSTSLCFLIVLYFRFFSSTHSRVAARALLLSDTTRRVVGAMMSKLRVGAADSLNIIYVTIMYIKRERERLSLRI